MKTTVINIAKLKKNKWWMHDDRYVYIGRPGKGIPGPFGNPIELQRESDRPKVLEEYHDYLESRVKDDADFRAAVKSLHGKILVCFCHPKACHGDILTKMVDTIYGLDQCHTEAS